MQRFVSFEQDEFYHIFNRGIDKRKIFFSQGDWLHFQLLLFLRNSEKHIKPSRVLGGSWDSVRRGESVVDICAYAMMPNHFHLLLREKQKNGITTFMRKLLTSFSMYMNHKYGRSGPLMCRPFRAKHIDSDKYFRWVLAYIHANPVELLEPNWKETGKVKNVKTAESFLQKYKFSSYSDFFVKRRKESLILSKDTLPIPMEDLETFSDMSNVLGGS